jgi:hypothetical protein
VDQIAYLSGLAQLQAAQFEHTFRWVHAQALPSDSCTKNRECRQALLQLRATFVPIDAGMVCGLMAWQRWVDLQGISDLIKRLCQDCLKKAKADFAEGRAKLWTQLPSYFDLLPWEDLEKEGEAWYVYSQRFLDKLTTDFSRS